MMFARSYNDLPQATRVGDVIEIIGAKAEEYRGRFQMTWSAYKNN